MRRFSLAVMLSFGTVAGFASGFAHLRHHGPPGHSPEHTLSHPSCIERGSDATHTHVVRHSHGVRWGHGDNHSHESDHTHHVERPHGLHHAGGGHPTDAFGSATCAHD